MRVEWHELDGLSLRNADVHQDARGTFTKLWDGAPDDVVASQVCTAQNTLRGTVRGLHLQLPPNAERKLVWCLAGGIWDVVVDARSDSPTYGSWAGVELWADRPQVLDVPRGFAHGYQTLTDGAHVAYVIDGRYEQSLARTLAWDDPLLAISWPLESTAMSSADQNGQSWPLS